MTNINYQTVVNLEIDLLRTFVAVAERNTFAAAAMSVRRTQSAVSQQMQRLEQLVGRELFARHGRNKALTIQGIQMLSYARKILALNDEACLALMHDDIEGTLRIGAPDDIASSILPRIIARFSDAYPQLSIKVVVQRSQFLLDMLKNGDVDLVVSSTTVDNFPRLLLRTSPSHWYSSNEYILPANESVPLVVQEEPSIYRSMAIQALDQAGISWRIAYTATTLASARAAVKEGLGIMARSIELWDGTLRVVSEAEGLPRLPDINYYLYIGSNSHKAAIILFEMLQESTKPKFYGTDVHQYDDALHSF